MRRKRPRSKSRSFSPVTKSSGKGKGGAQSPGSFLHAGGISEAVNLYAVALRTRRRLYYDAANRKITNVPEANKYLSREYRKGWNPESI